MTRRSLPALALGIALAASIALPARSQGVEPATKTKAPAASSVPKSPPVSLLTHYKARYQVSYRGISGGQLESGLHPGTVPNQWVYESRAYPNLLGRIAVSPDARQRSTMEVTASGVRPLSLVFDDGSDSSTKDVRVAFDWANGRVSGNAKEKSFDFEIPPDTQDSVSVQAAMIFDLRAGREPDSYWILNGAKLQQYRYWPEGRATVVTPYGQYDTVVWASQRDGSKRVNRVWHAPSLGFVPVQAIQFNKGRPDVQLKLVALERGSVPAGN
ncbi:MAG: DUF3108 domain-containing protein [Steroidobacteraceae bacterium]|nr:DUF3108 domain-containing protein [Steroidobacteraceae bacterium]